MNFYKLAASKYPTSGELNNPGVPGAIADYLAPPLGLLYPLRVPHDTRVGRARAMADATGQDVSWKMRNPMSADILAEIGGTAAGAGLGLGAATLAGATPGDSPYIAGAAGIAGGLLAQILMRHSRRKEMQAIGKKYDSTSKKRPGMPHSGLLTHVAAGGFGGAAGVGRAEAAKQIAGDPLIPFDGTLPTQINRSIDSGKLRELPE